MPVCPRVPKAMRRVSQVAITHDIIAVEDAAGFVATELHRHTLWNARANHVPDGGSSEVVRDTGRAPGGPPCPAPGMVKADAAIRDPLRWERVPSFVSAK